MTESIDLPRSQDTQHWMERKIWEDLEIFGLPLIRAERMKLNSDRYTEWLMFDGVDG